MTESMQEPSRVEVYPIHSEADLDRALADIDALMDTENPHSRQQARLEILTALVERYEEEHHPIPPPKPLEAIRFRLDQMGYHTAAEQTKALLPIVRTRARASEILNGRRPLSPQMVAALWQRFHVPLEALILGMARVRSSAPVERRGKRPHHKPR